MRSASGGPRVLLRRLRETMAEQVSAQERLDKIVVLIAANMVAEVCSTYVLRVDNTLELYATEGLNRDAVHRTVLSAHEGLVGLVASEATPLNLSDAQSHPAFSFRPETGEEIYHSFLGVPILRAGNTLGVLVVQNRAKRTYVEEEVEALQTTAMVLAEMIASGELSALAQPGAEPAARHSVHKTGAILSDGIALGHVVLHEPRVVITNYIAEDLPKEIKRLDTALAKLRADLDRMLERGDVAEGGEHRDVLEAYRMFANDHGWSHKLHEAVATGLTAEAAVERVQSDTRARMLRSTDPYLRDRLHDLEDLGHRLMRQLVGQDHAPSREQLPDNAILIARAMGPAALLDYDRKRDCAGWCWRKAPPIPTSRSWRARSASPRSAKYRTRRALPIPATPSSSTAPRARSMSAPRRKSNRPMRNGCGFAPGGRRNIRRCATSPASPRTASTSNC